MAGNTLNLESLLDSESREFLNFLSEIEGGNPRAIAIVTGAHIEDTLKAAIVAQFRELTAIEIKETFDCANSTLGTFSSKIQIGFALSLYSRAVRRDLKAVKAIRNKFAHSLKIKTFDDPEIVELCRELKYPSRKASTSGAVEETDPVSRFQSTAKMLFLGLAFTAIKSPLAAHLLHHPEHPDEPPAPPRKPRSRPNQGRSA